MTIKICGREGCSLPAQARGLCSNHYQQWALRMRAYGRFASQRCPIAEPRERVRRLRAAGVGLRQLEELTGLPKLTFSKLEKPGRLWVTRRTYELIMGLPVAAPIHELASPEAFIDSTGTIRRLRALARIGYGGPQVAQMLGIADRCRLGDLYAGKAAHVKAGRALAIADLFAKLEMTQGPSRIARERAAKKGWPLPLQWDEDAIDDPAAQPIYGSNFSTATERLEELQEMGITGIYQLAQRLDVKPESVERQLQRMKAATTEEGAA